MSSTADAATRTNAGQELADRFERVRKASEGLIAPLSPEDCIVQSMDDASPAKWHLAHTSWFFETLVLEREEKGYVHFSPEFRVLYNSYYNSIGKQHPRPERGLITRPPLEEVMEYRRHVDQRIPQLLRGLGDEAERLRPIMEVGLNHEQQHQELMLTDIKHLLSCNPLRPAYSDELPQSANPIESDSAWIDYPEGLYWVGHEGSEFAYDNETPRHRRFLEAFQLASLPVRNGEFLEFMNDGGYSRPEFWLSDGWARIQQEGWQAPFYWEKQEGVWFEFTLGGLVNLNAEAPVCHLSFFEADAYARWAGARLPSEVEWEVAAEPVSLAGNFVETGHFHPQPSQWESAGSPVQMLGDVWEWTRSSYEVYPKYQRPEGPLGEYNAKFACSQYVLRGGSCATPISHIRKTYRNFFPPDARWQFSGLRLARDLL